MKHEYPSLGIDVEFDGTLTVLREVDGAPIVFLLDERHGHDVVLRNIEIGDIVIPNRVAVIGAESHFAYLSVDEKSAANEDPRFANHFLTQKRCVVGVESEQLYEVQRKEFATGEWPVLRTHPFNYLRSHFFLAPLFYAWRKLGAAKYHLLLNVGRVHNDDIAKMIERGEIDEIAGQQASYVRIRSSHYPAP